MKANLAIVYEENHDNDIYLVACPHMLKPFMKEWHWEGLQWIGILPEEKYYDPLYHRWHETFRKPYFNPYFQEGPGFEAKFELRQKNCPNTRIVQYDSRWPGIANNEIALLKELFGEFVGKIEHIGSTAVPGMCARPTIDIMVEVEDKHMQYVNSLVRWAGYRHIKREGTLTREFFIKPDPNNLHGNPLFHLHIVSKDSEYWKVRIWVRDLLRTNKAAFRNYMRTKLIAIVDYPGDRHVYCLLKGEAIAMFMIEHGYKETSPLFVSTQ